MTQSQRPNTALDYVISKDGGYANINYKDLEPVSRKPRKPFEPTKPLLS